MRYPPLAKPGTREDALVLNIDLAPTFLEAAGLPRPEAFSGKSLMNILTSDKSGIVDPARARVIEPREALRVLR